jgi:hypothetical protein
MRTTLLILGLAGCATHAGAAKVARPEVPAAIAVPEGNLPALLVEARGVQIYECAANDAGALAWKLHAPRADLFDTSGAQMGIHYGGVDKSLPPGPYWESTKDGSRVHGGDPANVPNPGSIALLRLKAVDTNGEGAFSKVTYIHRLKTTGGVAPEGACTTGQTVEVPYTATYYFYVPGS